MRSLFLTALVCLAAPAVPARLAAAPALEISGNSHFTRSEIAGMLQEAPGRDLAAGLRRIVDSYRSAGYLDCGASWSGDSAAVTILISEGPRFRAGRPEFRGNSFVSEQYLAGLLSLKNGSYFDQRLLPDDLNRLSRAYAETGFPHAVIRLAAIAISGDTVSCRYDISEGPAVTIARTRFRGNALTRESTARRTAGLSTGQPFGAQAADQAVSRLLRSGLFTAAALAGFVTAAEPGSEDVVFSVREPRYNSIWGSLGYNQGAGQKGWLAGAFDLELRNISGTARQLAFHWERLTQFSSGLRAAYREPWLLGSPFGVALSIRHTIQDSLYVQTAGQILFTMPVSDRLTAGAGGSAERTVPGSQLLIRRSLQYSSLWSLQGDHRDAAGNRTGWQYRLQMSFGRKRYYDPAAQLTVSRAEIDVRWSLSPFGGQVIDLAVHGRALVTSERPVPRPDQYFLGGAGSVRGYLEQQFAGSQVAWINAEYKLAAAEGFELYPFADCGYLRDRDREPDRFQPGYGVGLRLDTRLGRIQIDYGLGRGDKPAGGKVHLILRNDF